MIDSLAPDDVPLSVLLVHGPQGIGKSALLREIGRRGTCAELHVVWIEGRAIASDPDALEEELADAWTHERPLVLIDDYDCMGALERHWRGTPDGFAAVCRVAGLSRSQRQR